MPEANIPNRITDVFHFSILKDIPLIIFLALRTINCRLGGYV